MFTWCFSGKGVDRSTDMVHGMPLLSIVMTWLFASMTVVGFDTRGSRFLYSVEAFLSYAINANRERST